MNSSVKKDEYPLVVCTNSWRDYAVTVLRNGMPDTVAAFVLEYILPSYRQVVESQHPTFNAAVGIANPPGAGGRLLAFRVFDAGVFRNRPHTVAIVGMLVPKRENRKSSLGAMLGRLPAPLPDSDHYLLREALETITDSVSEEPFASLDGWEARGQALEEGCVMDFCEPAELAAHYLRGRGLGYRPRTGVESQEVSLAKKHAWWLALTCFFLACLGVAVWLLASGGKPYVPGPIEGRPDDDFQRERAIAALCQGRFLKLSDAPALDDSKLKVKCRAAVVLARRNAAELEELIDSFEGRHEIEDRRLLIESRLKKWERPSLPSQAPEESPETAAQAVDSLLRYAETLDFMQQVVKAPDETNIAELQRKLQNLLK